MASFPASSIDFGVTTSKHKMQIMQTVLAFQRIKLTLKLGDHKEFEVQVPLTIGMDGQQQNVKFQLPLSLIENIYKADNSLVIPFKSVRTPFSCCVHHKFAHAHI